MNDGSDGEIGDEDEWPIQIPLGNSGYVFIKHLEDLPREAAAGKDVPLHDGAKSSVMIPLMASGQVLGLITFATLQGERAWPELVLSRLQMLARIFADVLARQRLDRMVRDSEARLLMATESANIGLWGMNLESGEIWATPKARELGGLAPDAELNHEQLMCLVHPEDLDQLRESMQLSRRSGEIACNDIRILLADGRDRWIASRCRVYAKAPGAPMHMEGAVLDITEGKRLVEELQQRLGEIAQLRKQLECENFCLREESNVLNEHSEIIGQSAAIKKVIQQITQVAETDTHVLITGETGTGKELVAQAIHADSRRRNHILVKVNCATLPPSLIESELFGREKGAYTDALTRQIGRFEMADGGTIFLDEIGEMSIHLQAKLLRVLQEGEFERLGGPKTIHVNVRVIAATNRNLADAVLKGEFRKDLFYRLSVFPIEVPPLRERTDDIPMLVWEFIDQFSQRMGKNIQTVPQKTMERLKAYSWPGNIRELRNLVERAMILSPESRLDLELPEDAGAPEMPVLRLKENEHRLILAALEKTGWHIKGSQGAAALLGLKPSTLYTKMNKYGIRPCRSGDVKPS